MIRLRMNGVGVMIWFRDVVLKKQIDKWRKDDLLSRLLCLLFREIVYRQEDFILESVLLHQ